jgi:FKBP-type peptidyl-prolyl cis-trans isomerase SlyD
MIISDNSVVSIDYILRSDSGEVIDSSAEGEPLVYLHGHEQIVPGLEAALVGKKKGDALKVTVAPPSTDMATTTPAG